MPLRLRKFIGAIALFALVIVWALLAMALAQVPAIRENAAVPALYYVIAVFGPGAAGDAAGTLDEQARYQGSVVRDQASGISS